MLKYHFALWGLLALSMTACSTKTPPPKTGEPAPAFTLYRLEGGQLQFPNDLKGKVVVILFWADWCPPCIREMHLLAPAYAAYQAQGVVILAINQRQDKTTVAKLAQQINASYEFLLDATGEVAHIYGVETLPAGFIIGRQGIIKTRISGEATPETFAQAIQGAL